MGSCESERLHRRARLERQRRSEGSVRRCGERREEARQDACLDVEHAGGAAARAAAVRAPAPSPAWLRRPRSPAHAQPVAALLVGLLRRDGVLLPGGRLHPRLVVAHHGLVLQAGQRRHLSKDLRVEPLTRDTEDSQKVNQRRHASEEERREKTRRRHAGRQPPAPHPRTAGPF